MASTFTDLGIEIMASGENAGTWGDKTNTNLNIVNTAIAGYVEQAVTNGGTLALTITDGAATATLQNAVIKLTGTITGNSIVTIPNSIEKTFIVTNGTSGAYTVQFKTVSGTGITFGVSEKTTKLVYSDGTNIVDAGFSGGGDLEGTEFVLDADGDTSLTADTDDQIDIKIGGADDFRFTANTFTALSGSTFVGDLTGNVSGTAATVTTAAQSNITSLGTLTTLTVDNIITNGSTIGHTSDTDLITLADGIATVAGEVSMTTLDIGGTNVTSTAAELNILDGVTSTAAELNLVDGITAGTVAASLAVIVDSNKDITSFRNVTLTGELDAATGDFSGDVDVDGTLEADAITVNGTALASVIAGTTVNNATTAAVATTVTITDNESTNENNAIVFTAGGDLDGGNLGLESDGDLKYNPSTGTLSATNISVSGTFSTVNSVTMDANNAVIFEGSTADAHETTLTSIDATGDRTISLPNVSGTLPVLAAVSTTQITSTPEELNALDGITAVVGELNALDIGSTAVGTAVASKAVILDSNKDYTGIRNLTLTGDLTVGGDDITMSTNTDGNLLVADGTNFNSIAISSLSEIATAASDDVFLAIDTSGGGLKKIARSAVVAGLATDSAIANVVDDSTPQLGGNLDTNSNNILIDDAHFIADESGNEQIIFQTTGSAVNQFDVTNAASGNGPQLSATGSDSNIDLNILAKGTGHITVVGNSNSGAIQLNCESNSHGQIIKAQPHSAGVTNVMLLPAGADSTLVSLVSTDTLTNKTLTSPKINEDVAVTSTASELNILDGVTSTAAELNILDGVTTTAAEINLIDGGASTGTTAVADADGILTNDGGTMRLTTAATFKTYFQDGISSAADDIAAGDAAINITTSSGNITIDAAANDSDVIFKGTDATTDITMLTLDGSDAGSATFNDKVTVGDGKLVLNATAVTSTAAELNILDGATSTTAEINLIDGGTSRGTTAVASGDGILINDAGTMRMTNVDTVSTYFASHNVGGGNIVTTGALGTGSIAAGFGAIDNGTSGIRTNTFTAETSFVPDAQDGAALGTTSLQFSDLFLADGAVIGMGDDNEVTLTHVADTGVLLNGANVIQLRDSAINIGSPADGDLDINADDEIELNSTLIDINGNVEISGTATTTGVHTFTAVPVFPNNTIESADIQADAITGAKIADNAINSEHYTDGSIDTAHIGADQVTGAKIPDNAINSEHYTDASIDLAHLSADCVNGTKIADNAINSEHYTDGSIDTAHIANLNVTQGKIADQAINEAKMQISNAPSNGYMLTAQSGNTGGMTWAAAGSGVGSIHAFVSVDNNGGFSTLRSEGISSVGDNGTGDLDVNYSSNTSATRYGISVLCQSDNTGYVLRNVGVQSQDADECRIKAGKGENDYADMEQMIVTIFD